MTERCLDAIPLLGPALDGGLPESDAAWVEEHVQGCSACQQRQALIAAQAAALRESLGARVDQADFSGFADRVMARVGDEEAAHRKPPARERLGVWLHEAFAANRFALGAGAGVAAAAAVALFVVLRPPAPAEKPADSPLVVAAVDNPAGEAQIEALDVFGQEGTVLQFPGQTVIWVTDESPRPRSAQ